MEWVARYWVEAGFAVISAGMIAWVRLMMVQQKAIKQGVKALLRDRIIQAYNHYLDKGFCPIYGREGVEALYKEYKALGGNGTVTHLVERLQELPTERV